MSMIGASLKLALSPVRSPKQLREMNTFFNLYTVKNLPLVCYTVIGNKMPSIKASPWNQKAKGPALQQ